MFLFSYTMYLSLHSEQHFHLAPICTDLHRFAPIRISLLEFWPSFVLNLHRFALRLSVFTYASTHLHQFLHRCDIKAGFYSLFTSFTAAILSKSVQMLLFCTDFFTSFYLFLPFFTKFLKEKSQISIRKKTY